MFGVTVAAILSGMPDHPHELDDRLADLLRLTAGGDDRALARLYDATHRLVYGLCLRILRDPDAADEAVMDVYMQVWRQAGQYDRGRGAPLAWLLTVARSRALDRRRARARNRALTDPLETAMDLPAGGPSPDDAPVLAQQRDRVAAALAQLSPEQRDAIHAAFFSGLSHSEVADALGAPLGTVKTRIRTGMMRLREILQPTHESAQGAHG